MILLLRTGNTEESEDELSTVPPPSHLEDERLPVDKLKDALIVGSRRGKKMCWHRRALGLSTCKQLNEKETQQFQIK